MVPSLKLTYPLKIHPFSGDMLVSGRVVDCLTMIGYSWALFFLGVDDTVAWHQIVFIFTCSGVLFWFVYEIRGWDISN